MGFTVIRGSAKLVCWCKIWCHRTHRVASRVASSRGVVRSTPETSAPITGDTGSTRRVGVIVPVCSQKPPFCALRIRGPNKYVMGPTPACRSVKGWFPCFERSVCTVTEEHVPAVASDTASLPMLVDLHAAPGWFVGFSHSAPPTTWPRRCVGENAAWSFGVQQLGKLLVGLVHPTPTVKLRLEPTDVNEVLSASGLLCCVRQVARDGTRSH